VEALGRDRQLLAAVRQRVLHDVSGDSRRGEPGLEVCQVLPFVRSESRDVDEADNVVSCAGRGNDRTTVGMTDEQDRPADLIDHALEVVPVAAAQAAERIWRSDDRYVFVEKLVVQTAKAGRVSERAMDENDGRSSHCESPLPVGDCTVPGPEDQVSPLACSACA